MYNSDRKEKDKEEEVAEDGLLNYTYKDVNLAYSHEPISKPVLRDGERKDAKVVAGARDAVDSGDMRSNRTVRNAEIHDDEKINENSSNSPIIFSIMMWISNTVSLFIFSIFITLIVTKESKWFYILLSVFVITTVAQITKVILMRYDAPFLYRPRGCTGEKTVLDKLLYRNFVLERIFERIDKSEYFKRGLPSMHMTMAASILTLIYLFFPKYKKIVLMTAPVYIVLLGFSRIYLSCHTLLQVICGIIFGMLGAKAMYSVFV
jgi:membrane-associated phospholipid phosphatase